MYAPKVVCSTGVILCFVPFRLCGCAPFQASDGEVLSDVIRDSDIKLLVEKSKLLANVSREGNHRQAKRQP